MPRAPLLRVGVTAAKEALPASWKGVTPSSSLVRAHAPDLLPSARLRHRLARTVFAACCQPLLGTGPSRRYLCRSFPTCLDLYSGCSRGARARYFPRDIGLPRILSGSARRGTPTATSVGGVFRSCSHSLMFRPVGLLATPVAPTSHLAALGSRGFYIRAYRESLPHHAADMLSVQNRAIDGEGTSTPQDRQPYRLLPRPDPFPLQSSSKRPRATTQPMCPTFLAALPPARQLQRSKPKSVKPSFSTSKACGKMASQSLLLQARSNTSTSPHSGGCDRAAASTVVTTGRREGSSAGSAGPESPARRPAPCPLPLAP